VYYYPCCRLYSATILGTLWDCSCMGGGRWRPSSLRLLYHVSVCRDPSNPSVSQYTPAVRVYMASTVLSAVRRVNAQSTNADCASIFGKCTCHNRPGANSNRPCYNLEV